MAIFTKDHRALHDFISGTIVYDKRSSTIFLNVDEEEEFNRAISATPDLIHSDTPGIAEANIIYKKEK